MGVTIGRVTGIYYLHLGDAQHQGGSEFGYRLRVSSPRPNFELRVVPSGINPRAGTAIPITVHALRKDSSSNEITLVLKDAPPEFTLSGAQVPAGHDQVRRTLTVPSFVQREPVSLCLERRAVIAGGRVSRSSVAAEDKMQAFAYRHLVPATELKAATAGRGARPLTKSSSRSAAVSKTSRSTLKLRGCCGWCPSTPTQPRSGLDFVNGLGTRGRQGRDETRRRDPSKDPDRRNGPNPIRSTRSPARRLGSARIERAAGRNCHPDSIVVANGNRPCAAL